MDARIFSYTTTYDVVTEESAEIGDTADNGFLDSHGGRHSLFDTSRNVLQFARAGEFDYLGTLERIAHEHRYDGPFEPSSTELGPHDFLSGDRTDYPGETVHVHLNDGTGADLAELLTYLNRSA